MHPRTYRVLRLLLGLFLATLTHTGHASEVVDYARDVKPLLKNKCYACHGRVKQEAGLRLDAGTLALSGGDNGKVVLPGNGSMSPLITRVSSNDEDQRMPPEGSPLAPDEIALLRLWIDQGAQYPVDEPVAAEGDQHWAFRPIHAVPIPQVNNTQWPIDPIDHFVLARLESRGWHPAEPASPAALLRRVYLDLIGTPPTIAEQDRFLTTPTADAYGRMVDGLLGRPGYGERYGRRWLDVVRYADSNGYERDKAKPEVWRYRDWVIRSLNEDKPFDRFVMEQLAGDEMPEANADTVLATGFNRLGPWDDEPADVAMDHYDQLDDLVRATSQAFLGLTLGCARCHDHKFDPLDQRDYYSMVAVFRPLTRPKTGTVPRVMELTRPLATPAQTRQLHERDEKIAELQNPINQILADARSVFLTNGNSGLPEEVLAVFRIDPTKRKDKQKKLAAEYRSQLEAEVEATLSGSMKKTIASYETAIAMLRKNTPDVTHGYFLYEPSPTSPDTHILLRGSPGNRGEKVGPAVPAFLVDQQPEFLVPDAFTSRRRLSLARWIVDKTNPLTSRVIVNRVWQWHFGQGLVRSPNNFGLLAQAPTHPELLDYLAHWFVHQADWSFKKLHRKIMNSRTYQMSRTSRPDYTAADPTNRLLWRQATHRLEVEVIRDSMLAVSGRMDRRMYGPQMHPFISADALRNHHEPQSPIWPAFDEQAASRRTIYAFIKRTLLVPVLEVLDLCDTTNSSPKRMVTTVPTQALVLYNGNFVNRQARHLAARLQSEAGEHLASQIEYAWRLAFSRAPTTAEETAMEKFYSDELELLTLDSGQDTPDHLLQRQSLEQLCRVILNLNEFVYPD